MRELIITAVTKKGQVALMEGLTGEVKVPLKIKILARGMGIKEKDAIKIIAEEEVICENPYTVCIKFGAPNITNAQMKELVNSVINTMKKNGAEEITDYVLQSD